LTSVDGDFNTFIGHSADASSGSLNNATAIGYNAVVDASNKVRIGNTSVTVIEGQVDFTYTSDKNKKENFNNINSEKVLQKLGNLNIQSWNYKHDPQEIRHYGPTAQEFFEAFGNDGVGNIGSDTTLTGSDVNGINMIAIQALEKRTTQLKEKLSEIEILRDQLTQLRQENQTMKAELVSLQNSLTQFRQQMVKLKQEFIKATEQTAQNTLSTAKNP
jgi:hypothetical protein